MDVRKPDLTAPRAKQGAGYCPINLSYWRKFKEETGIECTYKEFTTTIKRGNEIIAEVVQEERDGFRLLNDIGQLLLVSCDPPRRRLYNYDFGKLNKENVKIVHQNWETDRMICKILYYTYNVKDRFVNRKLWEFEGVRDFTRNSSAKFKKQHEIYKKVMYFERAIQAIKDERRIARDIENERDYLEDYNDFETE